MSRIIQILIHNHVFFLFIFLECISFRIFISNHFVAESNLSKKMTAISSEVFDREKKIKEYFFLKETNKKLLESNQKLIKKNLLLTKYLETSQYTVSNTPTDSNIIIQTKILRNSWNKKQNFMTVNAGEFNNLKSNMGVISTDNSLVGITHTTINHFATVITLINTDLMISAKIKNSGHYGSLNWNGENPNTMQLYDIPKHAMIKIGDTIVTSGYSNIIPVNIDIGTISEYQPDQNTNFLNISIDLFVDFTNIESVYIIDSEFKSDRKSIEQSL